MEFFRKGFEIGDVVVWSGFAPATKWTEGIDYINVEPSAPLVFYAFFAVPPDVSADGNLERVDVLVLLFMEEL